MQITNTRRFAVFIFLIVLVSISILFPDRNRETNKNKVDMSNLKAKNYLDRAPQKAINAARQALTLARELHYDRGEAEALWYLSWGYYNLGFGQKALEYGKQALAIFEKIGNNEEIARTFNHLGVVYLRLSKFYQALEHLKKAQELIRGTNNNQRIAEASINIGSVYTKIGQWDKALKMRLELDDGWDITYSYLYIGTTYYEQGNYDKAMEYLEKSYYRARGIVGTEVIINQLNRQFSNVYAAKKEYKKALDFFKLFYNSDKKLMNEKLRKQVNQLEAKYETKKSEKEIQVLKKEIQNLRLSRTKLTRNAFIAGFILISIILALLFKKYLVKKRGQSKKLPGPLDPF